MARSNKKQLARLYKEYDGRCVYCDAPTIISEGGGRGPNMATRDHLVPQKVFRRGNNTMLSLVLACDHCNNRRGSEDIVTWVNHCIKRKGAKPERLKQVFSKKLETMNYHIIRVRSYTDGRFMRKRNELDKHLCRVINYLTVTYEV